MNSLSWKSLIPLVIKKSSNMVAHGWNQLVFSSTGPIKNQYPDHCGVECISWIKILKPFSFFWQLLTVVYYILFFVFFPSSKLSLSSLSHNLSGMINTCTKHQYVDPYRYHTNPIAVGISTRLRFTKSVLGWLNFTYEYINNGPRNFEYLRNINSYLDFGQSHDWK